MKNLFIALSVLFLLISCAPENTGPPFEVEFSLEENKGRVLPILALTMGGNYTFEPEYPGEPDELPRALVNGEIIYGIMDIYQYVSQGFAKGFIDSAVYKQITLLINEETITDEWVDVIVSVAVGQDEEGKPLVFVEDETGQFDEENPVYFEPATVEIQDNVFEVMEAVISAGFEFYNGNEIVPYEGRASLMYLTDMGFESHQMYYEKLRFGTWTVNDQTYDVALIKESAPPYRKEPETYFYVDMDGNGEIDIMEGGMEAYPVTEPFSIAGESWEITDIAIDGSSITVDVSEEKVDPKVALRPGTGAPEFTAETLSGDELSLTGLRGKYVMIDFWGTWCGPCIDALPVIKEAYETYGGDNFEIVGIANEHSLERFEDFVKRENLEWPQIPEVNEESNEIQELYSVNSYPTYYLVNPEGEIVEYGMVAFSADNLMETLAKYLE